MHAAVAPVDRPRYRARRCNAYPRPAAPAVPSSKSGQDVGVLQRRRGSDLLHEPLRTTASSGRRTLSATLRCAGRLRQVRGCGHAAGTELALDGVACSERQRRWEALRDVAQRRSRRGARRHALVMHGIARTLLVYGAARGAAGRHDSPAIRDAPFRRRLPYNAGLSPRVERATLCNDVHHRVVRQWLREGWAYQARAVLTSGSGVKSQTAAARRARVDVGMLTQQAEGAVAPQGDRPLRGYRARSCTWDHPTLHQRTEASRRSGQCPRPPLCFVRPVGSPRDLRGRPRELQQRAGSTWIAFLPLERRLTAQWHRVTARQLESKRSSICFLACTPRCSWLAPPPFLLFSPPSRPAASRPSPRRRRLRLLHRLPWLRHRPGCGAASHLTGSNTSGPCTASSEPGA